MIAMQGAVGTAQMQRICMGMNKCYLVSMCFTSKQLCIKPHRHANKYFEFKKPVGRQCPQT